jgi:hypothetical protein
MRVYAPQTATTTRDAALSPSPYAGSNWNLHGTALSSRLVWNSANGAWGDYSRIRRIR